MHALASPSLAPLFSHTLFFWGFTPTLCRLHPDSEPVQAATMPSGPKKRKAAKRRSSGAGLTSSADRDSVSESHASDEVASSPNASDEVNARLLLDTKDRPADQTFQTEEWVRVSDFDVGTPTSTTNSKGDYDAGVEDSYGEARGHDKLADWETVSRETVGASSSAEESLEAEHLVADESSGSSHGRGLKLPHVDEGSSESSTYKDDEQEKSTGSNRSFEETSPGKQEEDRSSSIVVVPSPHEHEDDDSIVDVASHEAHEDEDHGSIVEVNLPEEQEEEDHTNRVVHDTPPEDQEGNESSGVVPVTLPDDQKDDDQTSSGLHATSPAGEEVEGDGSSSKEAPASEVKEPRHEGPVEQEPVEKESERPAESVAEADVTRLHEAPASKAEELLHDAPEQESEHEVRTVTGDDIYSQHEAVEVQSAVEDSLGVVGPATPDKEEHEHQAKTPCVVTRSISQEDDEHSRNTLEVSAGDQERSVGLAEVSSSEVQSAVQNNEEDAAPVSSGVPEPEQQELDQLLDMAHSKEIAALGREEEKCLAREEEDLGKSKPLAEILAATEEKSQFLQSGESEDLQPVAVEETPLVETPPFSQDSSLQKDAELIDRSAEVTEARTGKQSQNLEASLSGSEEHGNEDFVIADQGAGHGLTDQNLKLDESREEEKSLASEDILAADQVLHAGGPSAEKEKEKQKEEEEAAVPETDLPLSSQSNTLLVESEKDKLVPLQSVTGSELPKIRAEPSKDAEAAGLSEKGLSSAGQGGPAVYLQHYVSPKKTEVHDRPTEDWEGSTELRGCCEPVHWLLRRLFGRPT